MILPLHIVNSNSIRLHNVSSQVRYMRHYAHDVRHKTQEILLTQEMYMCYLYKLIIYYCTIFIFFTESTITHNLKRWGTWRWPSRAKVFWSRGMCMHMCSIPSFFSTHIMCVVSHASYLTQNIVLKWSLNNNMTKIQYFSIYLFVLHGHMTPTQPILPTCTNDEPLL